jgi:predicted ATP-grasp superfamily ATP-dependent carboligase
MKGESTIMEMLIEQVISRSKRLLQLKSSLNELATSVKALAGSVHRLAKVVDEHAVHLKTQGELNKQNQEMIARAMEQAESNSNTIQALQSYMGVSVVYEDDDEDAAEVLIPRTLFAVGNGGQEGPPS